METFPPWDVPWRIRPIAIRMRPVPEETVAECDGAAAGPQELWNALEDKYRPGEGGESFDKTYENEVWLDYDGYN